MSLPSFRVACAALTLSLSTMLNPVLAGDVVDTHSYANSAEVRSSATTWPAFSMANRPHSASASSR